MERLKLHQIIARHGGSVRQSSSSNLGVWSIGARYRLSASAPWRDNDDDPSPPSTNPPDAQNPDPATLREQWRYAMSLYSRWYSHAWGTAILAGITFFGLGWFVKGENPLPMKVSSTEDSNQQ